jgi:HEAT repeat protein
VNDPNDGALDRAREGLVDEALEAVGERLAVLTSPLPKVVESLRSTSVGERLAAIDRLTSDGARVAVPALRQALRAEQVAEVKLRLVGALGELGDPRAVEDLVAVADTRDIELLVAVLDALVVLGGERATEFLALLSTHDAPEIRALVEHARLRLERRVARPRPTERAVDAGGREVE